MTKQMEQGGIVLASSIKPGDGATVPFRVVLRVNPLNEKEYVTHCQRMDHGAFYWGHYFPMEQVGTGRSDAGWLAVDDYLERCRRYGLNPLPSPGVMAIPAGVPREAVPQWEPRCPLRQPGGSAPFTHQLQKCQSVCVVTTEDGQHTPAIYDSDSGHWFSLPEFAQIGGYGYVNRKRIRTITEFLSGQTQLEGRGQA